MILKNRLIVALDVNSLEKAKKLIDKLSPDVNIFKVGSELFTSCGPKIIDYLRLKRKKVFLDLKFFDIPNTVKKAILAAVEHRVFMLTLHIRGGFDMLKSATNALRGKKGRPLLIGVTVLTSKANKDTTKEVTKLAQIAKKASLDGVVCAARETRQVKKICGERFLVINPGIRPSWAEKDDQKRIATPKEAIKNGASFIVVGRPIIEAKNPVSAARKILKEISPSLQSDLVSQKIGQKKGQEDR